MKKKRERKLSKAEKKRKEAFEQMSEHLALEGYTQKFIGIRQSELNNSALMITIPMILPFLAAYFIKGNQWEFHYVDFLIALVLFFLLIVVHEGIHGLTWACFAKNGWKSISFGIMAESMTPYCHCNVPMKKYQMILGAMMPAVLLGGGFGLAAVISGSSLLLFVSILNMIGCGGDFLVIKKLIQYRTSAAEVLFIDHPYEIGTAVFEK